MADGGPALVWIGGSTTREARHPLDYFTLYDALQLVKANMPRIPQAGRANYQNAPQE